MSYYAVENVNGCEGANRLKFTVEVIAPPTPQINTTTSLCGFENNTLFEIEESVSNTANLELKWYDSEQGGYEISNSTIIEVDKTYYLTSIDEISGCESIRLPLKFSLDNCSTEEYSFFIPDGFSPNGDGKNDYYFIPNINFFYPNYTLEVYGRYGGVRLFKGDRKSPKWDGENTPIGVYFYILNYNKNNKPATQGRIYLSK